MNHYYNPVRVFQGAGCFQLLPEILEKLNPENKRVLILTWNRKILEHQAVSQIRGMEVQNSVFEASNPTIEQFFREYEKTKEFSPQAVVAIGGGSIMDVGKSLCCMYGKDIKSEEELRELIQKKEFGTPKARWIGVPTTSGTGSEVTCWATIWDPAKNAKRSVENHENYAFASLADPELTKGMPLTLAVSSALDAAAHAVESYWAKGTNSVSRALALQAIQKIMGHMEDLLEGKEEARAAMAEGSVLAGLAFSNTKTTACHSISYPLTMSHQIPHGAAVSMLLAPVLEMNQAGTEGMEKLLEALGCPDAKVLRQRIGSFLRSSGQPDTLRGWGVKEEEIPSLAEAGITKGRADNNPVEITAEKIEEILKEIY